MASGNDWRRGVVEWRKPCRGLLGFLWCRTHTSIAVILLVISSLHTVSGIMCVQCDTDKGEDVCEDNPPLPQNCTSCLTPTEDQQGCLKYTDFSFCVTVRKLDQNGTLLGVSRSCSPISYINSCSPGTDRSRNYTKVTMCSNFCAQDGCNHACAGSSPEAAILTALVFNWFVNFFKDCW